MTRARTKPAHVVGRRGAGTGRPRDAAPRGGAAAPTGAGGGPADPGTGGVPGPRWPTSPPGTTPEPPPPDRATRGDTRKSARGDVSSSRSRRSARAEAERDPRTVEVGPRAPEPAPRTAPDASGADGRQEHWPADVGGGSGGHYAAVAAAAPDGAARPAPDIPGHVEPADGLAGERSGETATLPTGLREAARTTGYVSDIHLLDDAVAAGETAYVRALADPRGPVSEHASAAAVGRTREAMHTAATIEQHVERHDPGHASWHHAGAVIPVLGAGAGVGTSVVAAALFDVLDGHEVPTLLVDGADPARSGLAAAVHHQGSPAHTSHPRIAISYGRRGDGWVAQLDTPPTEVLSPRMIPDPTWWLPNQTAPAATVVDLGWDSWQVAAAPLRGMGAWLEVGHPSTPRPVLVVAATRPSLAKANQLLTRLAPWISTGRVAAPRALVVVGATRWPKGVLGVANTTLAHLAEDPVFVPHDHAVALAGIGPDAVPDRLRHALTEIPARWGLVPDTTRRGRTRSRIRLLGGR